MDSNSVPTIFCPRLTQQRQMTERRVCFHAGVIDNEHMNRRKSKCCCIYRKPHAFGESSSSTDDECEHCFGHPEVRTRNRLKKTAEAGAAERVKLLSSKPSSSQ
ncbi:E3 ubiquitin-protein ligase PPP1R11-like [Drosophila mauritiana]|uniref:E3 ubiquitin-protein ligase PPP1R11 n=1 Tax=Drosophila mauritiana TaxID=7226 RepID=A0A6P8L2Z4_DROMA|nr:E3 ubiquitin-protein ligase PPP1R11-like [Drosophila mauritiana]XP_033169772.1 E3 ubiquitin-protein ligase PPP1R11-like [Drosophila mauritiana]